MPALSTLGDGRARPFHPPAAAAAGVLGKGIFHALVEGWNIWDSLMSFLDHIQQAQLDD